MKKSLSIRLAHAAAALASLYCTAMPAMADDAWPARPVTMVVPFSAGGTTDILARGLGKALAKQFKQPVVIDNRAGAGGTIGGSYVANQPADGYTLLLGTPAEQVNAPFLMAKPPFDPATAFTPVGCVYRGPNVLVVNPKLPAKNVAELIALAKAKPGTINFGSAGNGNTSHLSGELFGQTTGIQIAHIPYKGNAGALNDIVGGQIQMLFSNASSVMPFIQTGALRAIAVTSNDRVPMLAQVPTLRQSGVPLDIYSWSCLFVSAKTPDATVNKLHTALNNAIKDPDMDKVFEATGGERYMTSREEAARFLAQERKTWGSLIRSRNIKAD